MNTTDYRKMSLLQSRQRGLSLVELLVAIALGLFLSWGATQAFLSGKQTYSLQQALSRIQENVRLSQELIGYDVRDAGNYGCAVGKFVVNGNAANTLPNNTRTEFNFAHAVYGVDGVNAGLVPFNPVTALDPPRLAGTDILVVRTSTNLGAEVLGPATTPVGSIPTAAAITISNRGLLVTDVLSLADCTRNFIFIPNGLNPAGATAVINHPFGDPPLPGSTVLRLNTAIYYVANNAAGRPALYRRMLNGNSEELMGGVENLQLQFGVDTNNDGDVDLYSTPDLITDAQWSAWNDTGGAGLLDSAEQNVVAVRYSLLLRSEEQLLEAPQTYTYEGVVTVAPDRRLRQVFTNTVAIRSRVN